MILVSSYFHIATFRLWLPLPYCQNKDNSHDKQSLLCHKVPSLEMHNLIPNLPCHPSPLEFRIILRKSQVTIGADISVSRQNRRDGEHTHYVVVLYRLGTTGKNTQYQYHEFLVVNTSSLENRRPSGDETSLYFSFI